MRCRGAFLLFVWRAHQRRRRRFAHQRRGVVQHLREPNLYMASHFGHVVISLLGRSNLRSHFCELVVLFQMLFSDTFTYFLIWVVERIPCRSWTGSTVSTDFQWKYFYWMPLNANLFSIFASSSLPGRLNSPDLTRGKRKQTKFLIRELFITSNLSMNVIITRLWVWPWVCLCV